MSPSPGAPLRSRPASGEHHPEKEELGIFWTTMPESQSWLALMHRIVNHAKIELQVSYHYRTRIHYAPDIGKLRSLCQLWEVWHFAFCAFIWTRKWACKITQDFKPIIMNVWEIIWWHATKRYFRQLIYDDTFHETTLFYNNSSNKCIYMLTFIQKL